MLAASIGPQVLPAPGPGGAMPAQPICTLDHSPSQLIPYIKNKKNKTKYSQKTDNLLTKLAESQWVGTIINEMLKRIYRIFSLPK